MPPLVDVIVPAELPPGESFAQALARHPDRDVVIAPPRALLDGDRLARLSACAHREATVATIGPFSTDGPIAYGTRADAAPLDAIFARENAGVSIEVPSAFPPVVYLTRRALQECGGLEAPDPVALLAFSHRATGLGYRHLICGDVHVPAGPDAAEAAAQWRLALRDDRRLAAEWDDFRQRGPATPPCRQVDVARLRASPRPRVLFVTHHWGGGVELHVNDLARILADDCEVLVLRPAAEGTVRLQWLREGEGLQAWFEVRSQWALLCEFLRSLGVSRVHLHHVHGLPREAMDLPRDLGVPSDVTLHDHFVMCPQYHLADENGRYCGEPDAQGCAACLSKRPAQWGMDIGAWRELFHRVLRDAERVIVPSGDIGARVQRYFPDVQVQVWPHPELRATTPEVHKILLLGGLSAIKGMDLFEACVRDATARALPLHFHVLGHLSRPLDVPREAAVSVSGSYDDARLGTLVALERPDAFLFLSQVPETYSYTLSVAMEYGKPIVAPQLGAFPERLRGHPGANLVSHEAPARTVNDTLLRLVRAPAGVVRPVAISVQRA